MTFLLTWLVSFFLIYPIVYFIISKIDEASGLKVKIKKLHPNAGIPQYSRNGDAGLDLTAVSKEYKSDGGSTTFAYIEYDTQLAIEIPPGFCGLVLPRSSISNYSNLLSNSVGLIDSNYRGSIKFRFKTVGNMPEYKIGDRIGQLLIIPYPQIQLVEADELSGSDRSTGGFGSSGV